MRRIKRIEGGYTLETPARASEVDTLCDQCGNMECSIRGIVNRLKVNRFNAVIAITRCASFVPVLQFLDPRGLDGEFNTFRLGGAWARRVQPGDRVALVGKAAFIAYAKVINTHAGKFTDMDKHYGIDNHLMIDAALSGVDLVLESVMSSIYGKHRFTPASTVSVIELRREDGVVEKR